MLIGTSIVALLVYSLKKIIMSVLINTQPAKGNASTPAKPTELLRSEHHITQMNHNSMPHRPNAHDRAFSLDNIRRRGSHSEFL